MPFNLDQLEEKQNHFYRDSYRHLLNLLIFLASVGLILVIILGTMIYLPDKPAYYATTTHGDVIPMHALSEPVVTNDFIVTWASLLARGVFNMNFDQWQSQLNQVKSKFTPSGWHALNRSLKDSGFISALTANKVVSSAVVNGASVIVDREIRHGRFTWTIQLPLLINFSSASEKSKEQLLVTLTIVRVPVLGAPQGIQVSQFATKRQYSMGG